jgi:hypothetical protein
LPDNFRIAIIKTLSLTDVKKLTCIGSRSLRRLAGRALKDQVNDLFRSSSLDPEATFQMMDNTDTVLSGSGPLKIITQGDWHNNDLDFYTGKSSSDPVIQFFQQQGFQVVTIVDLEYGPDLTPSSQNGLSPANSVQERVGGNYCIDKVFTLEHSVLKNKLNLIESASESPLAPIAFFHSTLVMNFISADGVVCGYPLMTLRNIGAYISLFTYICI